MAYLCDNVVRVRLFCALTVSKTSTVKGKGNSMGEDGGNGVKEIAAKHPLITLAVLIIIVIVVSCIS